MQQNDTNLLDAITLAKEIELKASHYYLDAALKTSNPKGIALFKNLADFERGHYDALIKMENALRAREAFRGYKVIDIPLKGWGYDNDEIELNNLELIDIIDLALENEDKAEKAYTSMMEQSINADVRDLFSKLAAEERFNTRVLNAARTSLKQTGKWDFPLDLLTGFG